MELKTRHRSANRLSIELGVPSGCITDILNGRRSITAETAVRLGRYFGNSARSWLDLQSQYDIVRIEQERGKESPRRRGRRDGRREERVRIQIYKPAGQAMWRLLVACFLFTVGPSGERTLTASPAVAQAAAAEDAETLNRRGEAHVAEADELGYIQAAELFGQAAAQGYAPAIHNLAGLYLSGRGVRANHVEGLRLMKQAADRSHIRAMGEFGAMYLLGRGTPKDYGAALHWLRKAEALGDAQAMANLGFAYQNGLGVMKNAHRAVEFLRRADPAALPRARGAPQILFRALHREGPRSGGSLPADAGDAEEVASG